MAQVGSGSAARRQRWCVIFNCQAIGLSNCLSLLCDELDVEHYDPATFRQHRQAVHERLDSYDRVIAAPWVEAQYGRLGERDNIWRVPSFNFTGYHPDHCNLAAGENLLGGPLKGNFSALSLAAFRCGLDEAQTVRLYSRTVFERLGFLSHWDATRDQFLAQFRNAGLDLSRAFVDWSRSGPFAYIPTHPKIECLRDIAGALLDRAGLRHREAAWLPHDNIANGDWFPVYPEIASTIGVRGNYRFKPASRYQFLDLEEFVGLSFEFFRENDSVVPLKPYVNIVDRAMACIRDLR